MEAKQSFGEECFILEFDIFYSKSPLSLRFADILLGHQAFCSGADIISRPKESSLFFFVQGFYCVLWTNCCRHCIYWQAIKDIIDENYTFCIRKHARFPSS